MNKSAAPAEKSKALIEQIRNEERKKLKEELRKKMEE